MSDFVSEFWNWYIIVIVLVSIIGCGVFLWVQSSHHPNGRLTTDTTGHVWDETLEEYNNPLPRWWMWLFYLTVAFSLGYVTVYPALGRFPGLWGWTSTGQYQAEMDAAEARTRPLFDKYLKTDLVALAADKEAMEMGGRLFQTYCIQCHGVTAEGSRSKGFPNLTDKDWQWGGTPAQIAESIAEGRVGLMPPYGGNPEAVGGEAGAREIANYVRSLSGLRHDAALAAKGEAKYKTVCFACHGMDGKGQQALGAPNLTDKTWLYGSSEARIIEGIVNGRNNAMPPWKEFIGEGKVHLLAAYVISLGGALIPEARAAASDSPAAATEGGNVANTANATDAHNPSPAAVTADVAGDGASAVLDGEVARFYFATGKSDLAPEAQRVIGGLLDLAKTRPDARFSVSGFHDATGSQAANADLAARRARRVAEALKAAGIASERIQLDKPAQTAGTGEDKEARRVEVRLR